MGTVVRQAEPRDARGIHDAHMRSIREICSRDHSADEIRGWGNRPYDEEGRLGAIAREHVWVVEKDGKIEGFSELHFLRKGNIEEAYISAFYLTPEVTGRGVGKELLGLMIAHARARQVPMLRLNSTLTAHAFYLRFGFRDDGAEEKVEVNGSQVRNFPMSLDLLARVQDFDS